MGSSESQGCLEAWITLSYSPYLPSPPGALSWLCAKMPVLMTVKVPVVSNSPMLHCTVCMWTKPGTLLPLPDHSLLWLSRCCCCCAVAILWLTVVTYPCPLALKRMLKMLFFVWLIPLKKEKFTAYCSGLLWFKCIIILILVVPVLSCLSCLLCFHI